MTGDMRLSGRARTLTASGRSLLEHAQHELLTVEASFTPIGQSTTTLSRVIHLRR